ncbi:MAG: NAD(P)/FAD-dependent oxidoreductase [Nitrospinota bacterium]
MVREWDVIIVGAGPAGLFTALELSRLGGARVLILEKGPDLNERKARSEMTSGWGGAGAFSDGKLTLSPQVGGWLSESVGLEELEALIEHVDSQYLAFGAPEKLYGGDSEAVEALRLKASSHGLELIPSPVRHLGTELCFKVLSRIRDHLEGRVEIACDRPVAGVITEGEEAVGVRTEQGEELRGRFIVLAVGRQGAQWLAREAQRLKLPTRINPVDIGVRVEALASVLEPLTSASYEAKLLFRSRHFGDRVRTFCMCPRGEVIREHVNGVSTVNGHSYARRPSSNTNFAILVSTTFTEPFNDPVAYGRSVAFLANLLGREILVQRLGDLLAGRRSTHERIASGVVSPSLRDTTPGDLSFVLPYRYLTDILEMLQALDGVAPGLHSQDTLLYGVEVKFYSLQLRVSPGMETGVRNLFATGDGAGVSRGLVQASASGVLAAREIVRRLGQP